MTLLLLLGCYTVTESHCETDSHEVPDDERLAVGFTVADTLAAMTPQTVDAIDLFGTVTPIEVSVSRGDGAAVFEDATVVVEVIRPGGENTSNTWLGPGECLDTVEVPVALSLTGEGVAVSGPATMHVDLEDPDGPLHQVDHALDPATATLPPGLAGAPASGTVWVELRDGAVLNLEAIVVTEGDTQETVLWYSAE